MIKLRSAKAKGKRLEKLIQSKVLEIFPELSPYVDVRVNIGAEAGSDLKLSPKAREVFNFAVEAKYREVFKGMYKFYDQAAAQEGQPLLVLKMNQRNPLAVVDLDYFFKLLKELNGKK